MFFKSKKVKGTIASEMIKKDIKSAEELMEKLKKDNRYFSKPYSFQEIKRILEKDRTTYIYLTFGNQKVMIHHFVNKGTFVDLNDYFLNTKQFKNLDSLFKDETILGKSIIDNWKLVNILIMFDEQENQIV